MSDSYHVTRKNFRHCSIQEIEEQIKTPDSEFNQWVEKKRTKSSVRKARKATKEIEKRFPEEN